MNGKPAGMEPVQTELGGTAGVVDAAATARNPAWLALACECAIVMLGTTGRIGAVLGLLAHIAVVAMLTIHAGRLARAGRDTADAQLLAIAVAVAGPFGAIGGLAIGWLSRRGRDDGALLAGWYERIALTVATDPVSRLSDHVAMGRTIDLTAPAPESFGALLEYGTVAEQQVVLGLIARHFHPDYLPALQTALRSPEPVIRVQAAAVAARVRSRLGGDVMGLIDRASNPAVDPSEALRIAGEIRLTVGSGLLEETERVRVERLHDALVVRTFGQIDRIAAEPGIAGATLSAGAREVYEAHLLAAGRFEDFRRLRRVSRRRRLGRMRLRPMRRGAARRKAAAVREPGVGP